MSKTRLSKLIAPAFYSLHEDIKQRRHSEYWLMGGRGSTKSSFVSVEIVLGLINTPGANAIIYRKVAATLRESVYEQMITAIDWLGLREWFSYITPKVQRPKPWNALACPQHFCWN